MGRQTRRKILAVLDSIDFSQEFDPSWDLEFFNPSDIDQVVKTVEHRNSDGVMQGNVKLLLKILTNEVNQQGSASGQRQLHMAEVRGICARLVERNVYREAIHTKKEAFEAWRQVIEIILTACPTDLLSGELRQNVLFEVLQELLAKVSKEDAVPELSGRVAGVILTLMSNLRQCFLVDQPEGLELGHGAQYISLLDGTLSATSSQTAVFGGVSGGRTLYASLLQVVLRGLIEHLMRSSTGSQRVRANLYGSLLYYLQIAQKPSMLPGESRGGVGARVASGDAEYDKLVAENMSTISSYGDNFMLVVCRDASDGHDVCRMLSMATVDTIITMDKHGEWLKFMRFEGYLQNIIVSLLEDDKNLQNMLNPIPEPLRALFIFESKIGLLTRIAERAEGAHALLHCGLMSRLAECTIFDLRPQGSDTAEDSFIPSMLNRYRKQILFPILKLCMAVLTSVGIENKQTARMVLQFVVAHVELISGVLRERHPILNTEALKELALVTGVVGRAALDDIEHEQNQVAVDTAAIEFRGHLMRLQRQMIALLPKFCLSEKIFKQVKSLEVAPGLDAQEVRMQIQVSLIEISCNVVAFCRTMITKSGTGTSSLYRILFGPNLDEALSRNDHYGVEEYQTALSAASYPQSLGLIVFMMRQATEHFLLTIDEQKMSEGKLARVADIGAEELKELCGGEANEKMSSQQRQSIAKRKLVHIVAYKTQELQLYSYMIENCLLILWRHLDYYLLRCEPVENSSSLYKMHSHKLSLRRLQEFPGSPISAPLRVDDDLELPSGVTRQELETLKHEAAHCLNETLFKKLNEIEQCYTKQRNRFGFTEALARRIKRLINVHAVAS